MVFLGYGNLGRGVECAIKHNPDLELVAVFTRRAPETVKILTETAAVYSVNDAEKMKDKIDVLIICGGSATDLPKQTPEYAKMFNVIDSFDTHARIPEHFDSVDAAAKESGHIGIISVGWDPGMFSLNRLYANASLQTEGLYILGQGCKPGTFRCDPQDRRSQRRQTVHHPGRSSTGSCKKRRKIRNLQQDRNTPESAS